MERTLVLLKPSCVRRALMGEVISRFERKGLIVVGMKMMQLSTELLNIHYSHLVNKPFFADIVKSMQASPVVAMCVEGVEAVEVVRTVVGMTNSRKSPAGTIRGDYSMSVLENIVHASDSNEAAQQEIERFFLPGELFAREYDASLYYASDEI